MQKEEYWRRREEEERWRMEMRCDAFFPPPICQYLHEHFEVLNIVIVLRRYEEDMYWRRMDEEQHHWEERRRMPDGSYPPGPPGPPGLLGVRPGMPIPQPQGPVVSPENYYYRGKH